jgi:hypothetical protein
MREEHPGQLGAVAALLRDLQRIGAHHPDLNAKNIYLARQRDADRPDSSDGWRAYVLDVDRVRFLAPDDALAGAENAARLHRSLLKWRTREGLVITDAQLAVLAYDAAAPA